MSKIRSRDTKPELIVRRLLHRAGYRFRLHRRELPGKPDIIFAGRRKVIFIHGCFWHQHDALACLDGRKPKSNIVYWDDKLARNVERDGQNVATLAEQGWDVAIVWECETRDTSALLETLTDFLDNTKTKDCARDTAG